MAGGLFVDQFWKAGMSVLDKILKRKDEECEQLIKDNNEANTLKLQSAIEALKAEQNEHD